MAKKIEVTLILGDGMSDDETAKAVAGVTAAMKKLGFDNPTIVVADAGAKPAGEAAKPPERFLGKGVTTTSAMSHQGVKPAESDNK
jgi:hypothetical protein